MVFRAPEWIKRFGKVESGVVFVEALIAVPTMTFLTVGILEFANILWQRQQLQVGVRDAARYWSRCRPNTASGGAVYMPCTEEIARNIAFYGYPNPAPGTSRRVPSWNDVTELTITPAAADLPSSPGPTDVVTVTGEAPYSGSPIMTWVLSNNPTIRYTVEMRYVGW